jgi:hypothetical protein
LQRLQQQVKSTASVAVAGSSKRLDKKVLDSGGCVSGQEQHSCGGCDGEEGWASVAALARVLLRVIFVCVALQPVVVVDCCSSVSVGCIRLGVLLDLRCHSRGTIMHEQCSWYELHAGLEVG